jgi:DNA-binding NarL/FixJ family response regulator
MKTIRVLLVDDHAVVRAGLRALLEAAGDIQVIGEAENGQQAVFQAERLRPDVVLLDIAMPLLNGLEAARQIAHKVPTARLLVLSTYGDAPHVRQAVEAGAVGYLVKTSASEHLLEAVREASNRDAAFSPPLFNCLLKESRGGTPDDPAPPTRLATLSWRQAEVLQLIAEGYSSKQIAGLLSVSEKTVEKHRQTLMGKLELHNIANLTRYAVANRFVELNNTPACTPQWPLPESPRSNEIPRATNADK